MLPSAVDVAIVGAGTSGAAAAAFLAGTGARVLLLDRRAPGSAGARWVNGVPRAMFRDAGLAQPGPGEHLGGPLPFHMVAEGGRVRVVEHDLIEVDMRRLVARLHAQAAAAGAVVVGGVAAHGVDGAVLATSAGRVRCGLVVDASGAAGARLLGQPAPIAERLCAAAQEVREVVDRDAAVEFFASHGVPPGEVLAWVGVAGGYSVLNVRLHESGDTVGILTGSIPALGFPSGKAMLDRFVAEQPWIGRTVFGGAAAIPLGRPHDRLAGERVAILGDAAGQVFPAHGSGIGAGLVAARTLADVIARGAPLRDYEVAWQRRHGGLLAAYEVVRRWNQDVDGATLGRIFDRGLVDVSILRAGIDQVLPRPRLRDLPGKARALAAAPGLARGVMTAVARSVAVRGMYAAYPRRAERVPAWSRRVRWLAG